MTEWLVFAGIAAFGVYALLSMRGALRTDREAGEALRAFADLRGLHEETAPGPEPTREVSLAGLLGGFARRPAELAPPRGAVCYAGAVDGLLLHVDPVLVRRRIGDQYDPWTRLAVELPGLPESLSVRTRTVWASLVERLTGGARPTGDSAFDRRFVVAAEHAEASGWLDAQRRSALLDASRRLGRVEIAAGRLCLVRRGQPPAPSELDRLASRLLTTARALAPD